MPMSMLPPARLLNVLGVVIFALMALAVPRPAAAQDRFPPGVQWGRLETTHFEVLFPSGYETTARYIAAEAESAYRLLTPLFGHAPERRTVIILNDANDAHNGYATVHPRLTIEIELVPPDTRDTIYGPDYLRQIVFHEFAHILQLDATDEFRAAMRTVFGDPLGSGDPLGLPPNSLAPTWFLEGGAQWAETEFGSWGRGRLALTSAMLRAMVRAGKLPQADEAVLAAPDWPFGTTAYLWGVAVCTELQRKYGHRGGSVPGALSNDAADGFPGLFEIETKRLGHGRGAGDMFVDAVKDITARQNEILATLRQRPITPMQRLTPEKLQAMGPAVSADGRHIFFVGRPEDDRAALYRIDADAVRRLGLRLDSHSRLWVDPRNPDRLYFTRLEPDGIGKITTRLGTCNLDGGGVEWIARGRFNESAPIADADGYGNEGGWLRAEHQTDRGPVIAGLRFLRKGPTGDTWAVGRPRHKAPMLMHSPISLGGNLKAHNAAVVEVTPGGSRVVAYDTEGQQHDLFATRAEILDMAVGRLGELWIVCGEGGVLNLWRLDPKQPGSAVCMTNCETGLLEVAPTEAGVVAVALDEWGPYLVFIDSRDMIAQGAPDGVRDAWPGDLEGVDDAETDDTRELDGHTAAHLSDGLLPLDEKLPPPTPDTLPDPLNRDPAARLADTGVTRLHKLDDGFEFHYWLPFVTSFAFDFNAAGATAAFDDPLGRMYLRMTGGWQFDINRPFGDVYFQFADFEPVLFISATFRAIIYPDRVVTFGGQEFDYTEEAAFVTLGVRETLPGLDDAWTFGLDVTGEWRDPLDAENDFPSGQKASPPPFQGFRTKAEISVRYDSRTLFTRSVGRESGVFLYAAFFGRPPLLDEEDLEFGLRGEAGFNLSLPAHHLILVRAAGGWGNAPASTQSLFSVGGTSGFFAVRGYKYNDTVGKRALVGSVAWRFPLFQIYRGLLTTPFYWRTVAIELFADAGTAFSDSSTLRLSDFRTSFGAELQFQFAANGALRFDARIGYAYASERKANDRHTLYIQLGVPLQ